MPNHSRKIGNKLTSSSIASRMRKNTMDALLQRQHNLSSKLWIKFEKKLNMAQTYLLESPPLRNLRTKPPPLYLVILELYPSSSRAQSKEMAVWKRNSARYLVMISGGGPHNRLPAQMVFVLAGNITARQHKCVSLSWRALKRPTSKDTLYAGGLKPSGPCWFCAGRFQICPPAR